MKMNKDKAIYLSEKEKKRKKAKSGRPVGGEYVDPVNQPHSTIRRSFHDIPKDKWEKAFGKKGKSKDADKKT
ncbi:MAG: hypothetical protein CMP21_08900 [Rickettsiales bacterium]|nr:hypothetical protein [Rickettsiales bacterium]